MKADKITKNDRFELNLTSTKIDTFIFSEFIKSKKMAGLPDPDDDYVVDTDPPVDNNTPVPPSIGIFLFQDRLFSIFLDAKKRIKGRIRSNGFLRIFIVAFLLFIAPAGHLLTLT